jgi:hypothetical protein
MSGAPEQFIAILRNVNLSLSGFSPPPGKTLVDYTDLEKTIKEQRVKLGQKLAETMGHEKRFPGAHAQLQAVLAELEGFPTECTSEKRKALLNERARLTGVLDKTRRQIEHSRAEYNLLVNSFVCTLENSIPVDMAAIQRERAYLWEYKRIVLEQMRMCEVAACRGRAAQCQDPERSAFERARSTLPRPTERAGSTVYEDVALMLDPQVLAPLAQQVAAEY